MDPLSLTALAGIVGGEIVGGAPDGAGAAVGHVATHSDRVRAGGAFFALPGGQTDGHDHVAEAFAGGAAAAVVSRRRVVALEPPAGGALVAVEDPLAALQRLAAWWRARLACPVVAVAGSNGKTVTKDALVHFASYARRTYGSPGSYNSQLGVALALLDCPRDCELAVIEAAASEPGEMARLEAMIRPDHVVVTNLGARHLSSFGDALGYARELLSVASGVGPGGWVLLGDPDGDLAAAAGELRLPGPLLRDVSPGLPVFAPAEDTPRGLVSRVRFPDGTSESLAISTSSVEILEDVELAIAACSLLGVDPRTLVDASQEYQPTSTRTEIWQAPNGVALVRDVATADPIAAGSALRTARRLTGPTGRTIVVLAVPLDSPSEDAAKTLGRVIGADADAVYALRTPVHETVAASLAVANPHVPVRLFHTAGELRACLLDELRGGDVALVQSLPGSAIADLAQDLVGAMAPTRLYIDQSAVETNVAAFRRLIGPRTRLLGIVKALGYGTNPVQVSRCLETAGVDVLGVAGADEGVALRRGGVNLPVLVMLATTGEVDKMLRHRLTPLVYSPEFLTAVLAAARSSDLPVGVHLEVDSGMHRTGLRPDEAVEALRALRATPGIRLDGIMSHLGCADMPEEDELTRTQLARYSSVVDAAWELGFTGFVRHVAATAATARLPEAHLDMVRVGLGLYGLHPSDATRPHISLTPAISLISRIVETYDLAPGERVGYGGTYTAPPGGARIGVVPAGYHDCIPRAFSNVGSVVVAGVRCPIIGIVSMDSMTIDLSGHPRARVGSDVLIYGRHGGSAVSLEEVSAAVGTIPYELLARVGPRVQRVFTRH